MPREHWTLEYTVFKKKTLQALNVMAGIPSFWLMPGKPGYALRKESDTLLHFSELESETNARCNTWFMRINHASLT